MIIYVTIMNYAAMHIIEEKKNPRKSPIGFHVQKAMPEDIFPYNKKAMHPAINVLATLNSGKVTKLQRIGDKDYYKENDLSWHWGRWPSGVVAWMPLPEKYVEEKRI